METRARRLPGVALWVLCAAVAGNAEPAPRSHSLPLVLAADSEATGFVRVINRSPEAGTVEVEAIDDAGVRFGPVTLALAARQAVQLTSQHLEAGNAARGLPEGVGDGQGHWRLGLSSALDIEAGAYIRTADGHLSSTHDAGPEEAPGRHRPRSSGSAVPQGGAGPKRLRCPVSGSGGTKRVQSGSGSRGSNPRRRRAVAKRRAMRSAYTPVPRRRWPKRGSLSRPPRHWRRMLMT